MLLNWARLWVKLVREDRKSRRNPLADPLEGAEWRGLRWIVLLLSRRTARKRR